MNLLQRISEQRKRLVTGVTPKSISHHPELEGRVHVYSSLSNNGGTTLEDYADYGRVFGVYPWVHKAISKTIENVAGLPVVVVDANDKTIEAHPLTELFANANDTQTPIDLWGDYIIHKMLGGESFLQVVTGSRNNPVELWARRPDFMGVTPDESRKYYPSVLRYTYQENRTDDPLILEPAQCIHDKFPNPLSPWRGLAPISAVREGIVIDLFSQAWSKQFFRNGSRPDFAIVAPQGITQTERDAYLTEFSLRHRGIEGAHLPVILEQGVTDIKAFSFPPKDIEWLQQREFSRDEVGAIFGIPDEIMGYGRDTYENFQTALEVVWTLTFLPLVQRRDVVLNAFFIRHYPGLLRSGQRIQTDVSEVGVLQEDKGPKIDMAVKFIGMGIPFNTIDERLNLGIGKVEGGDVAYIDSRLVPLSMLAAQEERTRNPQSIAPPSQPGQMQDDNEDDNQDSPEQVERSAAWQIEAKQFRKWVKRHPEKDAIEFVAQHLTEADKRAILSTMEEATGNGFFTKLKVWNGATIPDGDVSVKAMILLLDPDDPEAEREARMEIERQAEERVAAALQKQQRRVVASVRGLNPDEFPEWAQRDLEEALSRQLSQDELYDVLRRMLLQSVDLGVSVAVAQFENIGFGFDWTLANEDARQWANQYTGQLIRGIDDSTRQRVRTAVSEWVANGEPLQSLIDDFVPIFGEKRASLIASTEVTKAYAEANRISYKRAGITHWVWQTANDERVCQICGPLNETIVRIDVPFDGYLPDEARRLARQSFSAPPAHPRCRCNVAPVVMDVAEQPTTGQPEVVEVETAKSNVAEYLGVKLDSVSIQVLPVNEFDSRFAGDYESLHGGIAAIRLPNGSIFVKQGFEQDAIHELIHAAGALPEGINEFLNEGITQHMAEVIGRAFGVQVRETYGKETRFVSNYIINTLPKDMTIQDFHKGYVEAKNKGDYVVNLVWDAHGDKFADVDEWGKNPKASMLRNIPQTLGTDLHLSYLVDDLGVRHP